jgi:hypothetical protein
MRGYWQRPDETSKVMTPDSFFRTGDLGFMTPDGYVKIVDRKKDMILVSGFNVYPNEVEEVVAGLSGVMECAVIGIPDERSGEAVKLVVVKKDPALTEAQVLEHCRYNLTGYKMPRVVEFRDTLPKTPVGKVLRRELRDKGVPVEEAESALATITDESERQRAGDLVRRKIVSTARLEPQARVRRLTSMLALRGYPPGICFAVVAEVLADSDTRELLDLHNVQIDG